jgi:hypothetical protein
VHVHLAALRTVLARAVMPYEDQLELVHSRVGSVARGRGHVMIAENGSCSLAVALVVQLEAMLIPYEGCGHMGLSLRGEGEGVHLNVGGVGADGVGVDGVAGHNEDVRSRLPEEDKKDPGRIELKQSVVWLEGWAAKHRLLDMAVYAWDASKRREGEE